MKYGRYKILNQLGKGSMGEVYLAHDPHIDRKVALKVLHKSHVASKEIIKRFMKEAKAIGKLSHPDIVSVYDVGQDHGTIYIAMEYLKGEPLNEVIQTGQPNLASIVKIGRQVALALDYAHEKGIVHRDVKPSNLIMTEDNRVKLTDFGIARFEDASLTLKTRSGDILGTPAYMSPEQIEGKAVDKRSDIYSLGVILYELMVGQRPFMETNIPALFKAITDHNVQSPRQANPVVPKKLSAVISKAMARNPDSRYSSGAELSKALIQAFQSETQTETGLFGSSKLIRPLGWGLALAATAVISWMTFIVPKPDEPTGQIPQQPRQETASVNFSSEPTNANIYLNNTFKGKTPLTCKLPMGLYDVRLTLNNHYESEAQIDVRESDEMPVHLRLIPKE